MDKHIVFLMHGMGNQAPGWSDKSQKLLKDKSDEFGALPGATMFFDVEFVELNIQNLLNRNMEKLIKGGESLGDLTEFLNEGYDKRKNNPDFEGDTTKEKIALFVRDFALDVFCYNWNDEFKTFLLLQLAEDVLKTIKEKLEANLNDNVRFSFIAHSLGTKFSFDLLHRLYTMGKPGYYKVDDSGAPMLGSPSFSTYIQLSSVSQILSRFSHLSEKPNNSHVRIARTTPRQFGIVDNRYGIYNNNWDVVSWIGEWNRYENHVFSSPFVNLDYLSTWNMHNMDLYISHPAVYCDLMHFLYGYTVSESQKKVLITTFEQKQENQSQELKQALQLIKQMFSSPSVNSLRELVTLFKNIFESLSSEL